MSRIISTTINERFDAHVAKSDGCWEWTASVDGVGYGKLGVKRKMLAVHRLSYERFVGPIPQGMFVCHRCDNRRCVRPDHLFLGTHLDNMRDMIAKGRSRNPSAEKTHCIRGHEFTVANTRRLGVGPRVCRQCVRERERARPPRQRIAGEATAKQRGAK